MARRSLWLTLALAVAFSAAARAEDRPLLLVFSKTAGFRHAVQIEAGLSALQQLALAEGFDVELSEDAADFEDTNLARYAAVLFFFTSGDVLDRDQEVAFENYIAAGGGYVGVHSATDTEYAWPFYGALVGAWFANHPASQTASLDVVDGTHPSTRHLDPRFDHFDEWYNFDRDPSDNPNIRVLLNLDESTYQGGTMGSSHPIAWCQEFSGGRSWYTAMGHTLATEDDFLNSFLREHLLGGIQYAAALPEPSPRLAVLSVCTALALLHPRRGRRTARWQRDPLEPVSNRREPQPEPPRCRKPRSHANAMPIA